MIKILVAGFILATCTLFPGAATAQSMGRVVYLNLETVFSGYHKTRTADARLKQQAEAFNIERQGMIEQLVELRDTYEDLREDAINEALDPQVRLDRQSAMEDKLMAMDAKEAEIRRFDEMRTQQLEGQGQRMRRSIVEEVRRFIADHAREQGYLAVLDSSGRSLSGVEMLLYLDPRHDVTNEVLALLNRGSAAEDAPALPAPDTPPEQP